MKIKFYLRKFSTLNSQFSTRKGFTLIELLIVIAILGILAAGILVAIDPIDKINNANDTKVQHDISSIAKAAEAYAIQQVSYPATSAELAGELKSVPVPPTIGYGAAYTYTPLPTGCTTAAKTCTSITISSPLLSKKYKATPKWQYDSATGKSGAVDPRLLQFIIN